MNENLAHKEDCEIVRDDSSYDIAVPGCAVLMDNEGARIFTVPKSWTDEQIWECLRIANRAFAAGHDQGMRSKAREISSSLYLPDSIQWALNSGDGSYRP